MWRVKTGLRLNDPRIGLKIVPVKETRNVFNEKKKKQKTEDSSSGANNVSGTIDYIV
jgi:hypothetical protein